MLQSVKAKEAKITVIDFESTGSVPGYRDEPWQVGLVSLAGGEILVDSVYESLLQVGDRPFNAFAPGRHALLRSEMAAAPRLPMLWPLLKDALSAPVIAGHNVATEKRFLLKAFPLLGTRVRWMDSLRLLREALPGRKSYKLGRLIADLGLEARVLDVVPDREPHDALYDAVACAALLEYLFRDARWGELAIDRLTR